MKNLAVTTLFLFVTILAFGQTEPHYLIDEISVNPPQYTGIDNFVQRMNKDLPQSINQYLIEKFTIPDNPKGYYEGTEIIEFVVLPDGHLTNFKVINGVSSAIDEELIRILNTTSGNWLPGMNNDVPVAMKKQVSLTIRLTGKSTDFLSVTRKQYSIAGENFLVKRKAKKALKHYNTAARYLPNDKSVLLMRGLCKYELGDTEGARTDWLRLKELGGVEMTTYYFHENEVSQLSGYKEMLSILTKQ